MNNIILLLTACINPDGMPFTFLIDKRERLEQYKKALNYYLNETTFPIVFAENSCTDISKDYQKDISKGRLELITFDGNNNKQRGKGYGEANIIDYALKHSRLLRQDCYIIKITGRLIVENINIAISKKFPFQVPNSIRCSFHSDLKFCDSRFFGAPIDFFRLFIKNKDFINDNQHIYFEHILANCAIESKTPCYPFWKEPSIKGISGSTGKKYKGNDNSTYHIKKYRLYILKQIIELAKRSKNYPIHHIALYSIIYIILIIQSRLNSNS